MPPCLWCWTHALEEKLSPSRLGLGFLCVYSIDETKLEANFSKLIQEHSEMFEGLCCLMWCKCPKGMVQDQGWKGSGSPKPSLSSALCGTVVYGLSATVRN